MLDNWIRLSCPNPSAQHAAVAEARQNQLTKPRGALGLLEKVAINLAALQSTERPSADRVRIVIFAGDHGVTAQGVSAYPAAVTVEMLRNFVRGGAAISVLAREIGAPLEVVDVGTRAPEPITGVTTDKPRCGTRDFSLEAAMTAEEVAASLASGRRAVERAAAAGADILILGEMGIGNTTSATAIAAALLALPPSALTGAGTGLDDVGIRHKADVVARAVRRHGLLEGNADPLDVLVRVGGFEIAALTGALIASAQANVPVLVDGFIVSVAALLAVRLNPSCRPWLLFSHRSSETGHQHVLSALGAEPLLDLKMRLGEGSGAALVLPVIRLACALHNQMATFEEASVSDAM